MRGAVVESSHLVRVSSGHFSRRGNNWLALAVAVVVGSALLASLANLPNKHPQIQLAEAKTHHSKRQAPQQATAASPFTGRENTNWWNVWWQRKSQQPVDSYDRLGADQEIEPQTHHSPSNSLTRNAEYIQEAERPTVRPIVSVSYGDQSLRLAGQDPFADELDRTNMVPVRDSDQLDAANIEHLMQNERLRQEAPFGAKPTLLAHKKSMQHQAHWQSVKPTIIQPRATRQPTTRQAEPELTYGIQMRNSRNQVQQQQMVDDVRFEQQQNQMLDYTEEAELEPSSESPVAPNNDEAGARSTGVDSSSSSMMSEPERRPTTGTQRTTQQRPVQATSTTRANEPTISTSSSPATEETGQAANEAPATSTTQTPVSTTTAAPSTMDQTTAKTLATTTTTTASNETPSPATRDSVSATTTTPPARVQLQNGRPANGMRQVGVTSAARIPTISSGQQQPTTTPPSTTNTTPTTTTLAPTTVASTSGAQPTTTRAPATTTVGDESEAKSTSAQGETTGASTTVAAKAQTDSTAPATKNEVSTVATPAETSEETNEDSSSAGSTPAANAGSTETETGDTDDEEEDEDNSNAGGEEVTTDATPANATTTTAQTPTPASVELTRLPKVGQQTAATPTSMNLMREASSMVQQEGSQPSGDIVRIRPPVGTGRMPVGEETAITMPMDTLLNMMNQANEESDAATQSTTAPKTSSGFGERTTMTGGQDSATTRRRLQPPPTTQMPNLQPMKMSIPAQTSLIDAPGQSPDAPLPKMVMVSVQSPTDVAPASDDGRTEMLNLDLMPIQRIMNNQMMAMRKEQPQGEVNKQPEAEQEQQVDREAPVEPGMRLRPPKTQPQRQQQQPAIVMGNQKDGQANTVYMVMMGGSQSTSTDEIKRPRPPVPMTTQAQIVQTPTTLAPSTTLSQQRERLMTTKSAPATTLQTTRRQPLSTTPNVPTTTGAVTTTTRRGEQPTMTTLSGQFSRTQPTSTMSIAITTNAVRGTTSQAATMTTTARPRFAETMMSMTEMEIKRQREQVEGMRGRLAMSGSEQQTSGPMTTTKSAKLQQTATTTAELMSTTQKSPATTTQSANGQNLIASKDTTATRQPETTTAVTTSALTTTTTTPAITTPTTTLAPTTTTIIVTSSTRESNQSAAPTTTNAQQLQPTSTTVKQLDNVTTTNPTTAPQSSFNQTTTTTKPTTSGVQQQTSTTTITTTTTTTTQRPDSRQQSADGEVAGSGDEKQLDKIQQQPSTTTPPQVQRPKGAIKSAAKTGKVGRQSNQTSSSFIPSKLRTDFNRLNRTKTGDERQSVSTTTQSPLTGMAIRQFGGANRMSLLGNQPVPFGRPAAMTMHSASPSRLQVGTNYRVELPSFEYGPSIAVRRPDEPLANGQVPNCTLTGKNFCVLTKDYPMNEVRQAVERSFRSVRIMYEELQTVSDQELHKEDFNVTNNQAASGRFACQTQMEMMRPGWAKDEITKEWMLVVNTDVFPQRVRTESCAQPNTPCEFIAPFYDSTCQQRYSLHRLIAIDPHDPSRSPQVAVFRFPAGCVCRVHPIRKTTTTTPASRR